MSNWEEIRENIVRATQASQEFKKIGNALVMAPDQVKIQEFAVRMDTLQKELQDILTLISPGSTIALDELAEAFSQIMESHPSRYRRMPKISMEETSR